MSSYIPAKHKNSDEKYKNGTSCMVRGFWGDIIISPYMAYGTETEYSPEKEWMFRTINMSMASTALEVSTFQILYWLKMLQQSTPHRAPVDNPYISQQQKEQIN
jgi:dynein assembly factor 3